MADRLLSPGVLLHDDRFLVFLNPPTIVCQGYMVNKSAAKSIEEACAEPAIDTYNLYTITKPTSAQMMSRDCDELDQAYHIITPWKEPGHQPADAKYEFMPHRK